MNWVDGAVLLIISLYLVEGLRRGFIEQTLELFGFFLTIFVAFWIYKPAGAWLIDNVGVTKMMADPLGFLIVWIFLQILFSIALRLGYPLIPVKIRAARVNREAGILPAFFRALIVITILLTFISIAAVPSQLRNAIDDSWVGPKFLANSSRVESALNTIFGRDIRDGLSFITVPVYNEQIVAPNESVELGFEVTNVSIDYRSEQQMLGLINRERANEGLAILAWDESLSVVARDHSRDMFAKGYFSHRNREGLSPFERMNNAGITYRFAGENLAFAANVTLAHGGLMRSPGHRANIMQNNFQKVGIGVIDGGVYGKMFTQVFSD